MRGYITVSDPTKITATYFQDLVEKQVTGENVGVGDGTTTTFTLANVGEGIVYQSETIYLDGVAQTRDTDYTINYNTGQITFTTAPASGVAITADYKYLSSQIVSLSDVKIEMGIARVDVYSTSDAIYKNINFQTPFTKIYHVEASQLKNSSPGTAYSNYYVDADEVDDIRIQNVTTSGATIMVKAPSGTFTTGSFIFVYWIVIGK